MNLEPTDEQLDRISDAAYEVADAARGRVWQATNLPKELYTAFLQNVIDILEDEMRAATGQAY